MCLMHEYDVLLIHDYKFYRKNIMIYAIIRYFAVIE